MLTCSVTDGQCCLALCFLQIHRTDRHGELLRGPCHHLLGRELRPSVFRVGAFATPLEAVG